MSDSYCETSFQINVQSPEELAWWKKKEEQDTAPYKEWELIENETQVWFHDDTNFDVEEAIRVIQEFLMACRPEGSCGFSWALSCSKPMLDEFSGGACFITAKESWVHNASDWLQDKYRQAAGMG